jgi:hypothetical protein
MSAVAFHFATRIHQQFPRRSLRIRAPPSRCETNAVATRSIALGRKRPANSALAAVLPPRIGPVAHTLPSHRSVDAMPRLRDRI